MITANIEYALLAFIPALLNACIILYILFRLPKSRTTDIFTWFVFALVLWQIEDGILRVSLTAETARFWDSILSIGWLGVPPLAFHFAARYAGIRKLYSRLALFLIYGPFVIFEVVYVANIDHVTFSHGTWGWLNDPRAGSLDELQRYWMSFMILGAVIILVRHAAGIRKNAERKMQAWLIAVGILIPAVQGIITQVALPLLMGGHEIPLTSTFMTLLSIATIFAFSKFKSLNVSESIQSHTLLEDLNKLVFIVSPGKKIIYSNQHACDMLGISEEDREFIPFANIFPASTDSEAYYKQVFDKVLLGEKSDNFHGTFRTMDGKKIEVLLTSRLVTNNNVVQGVLLVASDITERTLMMREREEERLRKGKEITDAVMVAQEKERKSIGGELHDNVNQILATSLLYLNMVKKESEHPHPFLDDIGSMVSTAINEIRNLSHTLIAPSMNETELTQALDKIIDTAGKSGTLSIEKDLGSFDEQMLPEKLKLNIYRIVQEQFNNIIKYASASTIQLKLVQKGENLILRIRDDGVGFDPSIKSKGVGLLNMKTRASLHNGKLRIVSSPGKGCELTVLFEDINSMIA